MDLELEGKVAVITGGSRGLGQATAFRLADEGCSVAICARHEDGIEKTLDGIRSRGRSGFGQTVDVTRPGALDEFMAACGKSLGGVDLLVASAGGSTGGPLVDRLSGGGEEYGPATDADWQGAFELNLLHGVRAARAAVPLMRERGGGSIVFIASVSAFRPAPRAQYGATKLGLVFLAQSLARELARYQIRVNAVSPGGIMIPDGGWEKRQKAQPEAIAEFVRRALPYGRFGTREEVADVIAFLLSPRASWIDGANIAIDGAQDQPLPDYLYYPSAESATSER